MVFPLYKNTPILCDAPTIPVRNAIEILRRDLESVLTQDGNESGHIVISIPQAQNIHNETYQIAVTENEIHITAGSSLGAIFAILRISREFLNIHPFWFWLDKLPEPKESAAVQVGTYQSQTTKLRFRGWFINDEVLLDGWKPQDKPKDFVWRMAMEVILRLGGNMVIPGTDINSRINRDLASEMGLWITHHHAEPLGAELFAREYPDLEPNYLQHREKFQNIWQQGIRDQQEFNVIWTLGFRGQGDRPFWEDDPCYDTPQKRGELMSAVIREQYAMVHEKQPDAVCCINLYGETLELYKDGYLDLPKDVIYVWADNGYGKMVSRRQSNHNPRIPAMPDQKGRHGVYYHASFYDLQASNHITMLPNPPKFVCDELSGIYDKGADDYWIINCGSIRPHCYILDLIADLWTNEVTDTNDHNLGFVQTYYEGDSRIANLLGSFSNNTVQYGPHADEKAGEELYHYPVRQMATAWMCDEIEKPLEKLIWLCENKPFPQQIKHYHTLVDKALKNWESYLDQCGRVLQSTDGDLSRRFYDHIQLQAEIHYTGALGATMFCESYTAAMQENYPKAFVLVWKAKENYKQVIHGFEKSEHDIWKGYYSNDCLTDIRLTVDILEKLQGWLRIKGEGADSHLWYRNFLMDEKDRRIALLLYTRRPPTDDVLASELANVFGL